MSFEVDEDDRSNRIQILLCYNEQGLVRNFSFTHVTHSSLYELEKPIKINDSSKNSDQNRAISLV